MTSGRWLEPSSEGGSLEVVINKEAKNYFNDSPYAAGNVKSTLSLTPFNIVGVVNDGRDFPTIYADSAAILNFAPAMWQVQNVSVRLSVLLWDANTHLHFVLATLLVRN